MYFFTDPNHFDNPVYAMKVQEDNSSLLNNQVHNNLGNRKTTNLHKSKLEEERMYLYEYLH